MKQRLSILLALSLAFGACGKKDADKTEPGSTEAKAASAPAPVENVTGNKEEAAPTGDKKAPESASSEKDKKPATDLKIQPADKPATETSKATGVAEKRITGPVALVNGQPIPSALYYAEVDKIMKRSAKIPPERLNRIKDNILKRLVEKELIRQAVKKEGVQVPAKDIDADKISTIASR